MATAKRKAVKRKATPRKAAPRRMATQRQGNQRVRLTDERKAELLAVFVKGGPELVAKTYGYKLAYAQQLAVKVGWRNPNPARPRGEYTEARANATRVTKAVARYLDQCREGAEGKPGVWLGSLKGYPARTSDPATVEAVIQLYERELLPAMTSPVQEIKARQRVMTLRRGLDQLRRAANGHGNAIREDFVLVARGWAEYNGISYAAFREMGVPADVLREAGITA